jgi:hypothetical protein
LGLQPHRPNHLRGNCLWALWGWRREGGYFHIRRSHYGIWPHFLWTPPGSSEMLAFIPVDAVDPAEWHTWPWWQKLMWWRIWHGRPRDLFWFDGQIAKERNPNHDG